MFVDAQSSGEPNVLPPSSPAKRAHFRAAHLAWLALFVYIALALLCVGVDTVYHFTGSPIDGPFQLFNALRRIDAGQRIGVQFQFFHGPAVPYLHLGLFRLFGRTFFASELARQVVSLSLFIAGYLAVFLAWTRSASSAIRLTVAATLATVLLRMDAMFLPINSMLGVRSTMPMLAAAVLALRFRPRARLALLGVATGAALLIATEQGIATIAALALAGIITILSGRRQDRYRIVASAAIGAAVAGATYGTVLLFLGGRAGFLGALRYNFGVVPRDQFWYFGAPPNPFLSSVGQLFRPTMAVMLTVIIATGIGTVVRFVRHRRTFEAARFAELFFGLYAIFSIVPIFGTFVPVYLEPGIRVAIILSLLALRRWADARSPRWSASFPALFRWREGLAVTVLAVAALVIRPQVVHITLAAPLHVAVAHVFGDDPPLLSGEWAQVAKSGRTLVKQIGQRTHRPPVIWSTYAGIVEANAGVFNPSFDYIIHALGPLNRRAYARTFAAVHPDLVQTIRPSYSFYEEWLEGNHWELYREILRGDTIAATTSWSYFWLPREHPYDDAPTIVAEGALTTQEHGIALTIQGPPDSVTVLEVRLRYHVINPYARFPFFGGLPRYIIEIAGAANRDALSLAPYETERRFPVLVKGTATIRLAFSTKSLLPGASFVVDSARVTRLQVAPQNQAWVADFVGDRTSPPPD